MRQQEPGTVGASLGWRAMFLCGLVPAAVSIATLFSVKELERWEHQVGGAVPER